MSRCRSCGAQVTWAKTELGKSMPIERVAADGNLTFDAANGTVRSDPEGVWISHFATCAQADEWRRK